MREMRQTLLVGAFMAVATMGGFTAPAAAQETAQAQTQAQAQLAVPQIEAARLKTLAALHADLIVAREDFQAKLGRIHEEQGQQVLRDELAAKKAELYTKHGITEQEYQQLIFVVSVDPAQRELFEAALVELDSAAGANGSV